MITSTITTIEDAYSPAQMFFSENDGMDVRPFTTAEIIKDGDTVMVPTMKDCTTQIAAGNFNETLTYLLLDHSEEYAASILGVGMSGASSPLWAIRARILFSSNETESAMVSVYDPAESAYVASMFCRTTQLTRKLIELDRRLWSAQPFVAKSEENEEEGVVGRRVTRRRVSNLMEVLWKPSFLNTVLDEYPYVLTEVHPQPGDTMDDLREKMAQAFYDTVRRRSQLPLVAHKDSESEHPWARPLFNHFLVKGQIKWLTSIGTIATLFHLDGSVKSTIEAALLTGVIPPINDYVEFTDPRKLPDFDESLLEEIEGL